MVAWPANQSSSWSTAMKEYVDVGHSSTGAHSLGELSAFASITFTRDMAAANGEVAHTGVGFKPRQVVFFSSVADKSTGSWGVSDGTISKATFQDNSGVMRKTEVKSIVLLTVAEHSYSQQAYLRVLGADGFTLTWSKTGSPTGTATIIALCLK